MKTMLGSSSTLSFLRSYIFPHLNNIRPRVTLATLRTLPRIEFQLASDDHTIYNIIKKKISISHGQKIHNTTKK